MTRHRNLVVELAGAALRDFLLPALRRLADALDPSDTAPGWTPLPRPLPPLPDERLYVPKAWVEMEGQR